MTDSDRDEFASREKQIREILGLMKKEIEGKILLLQLDAPGGVRAGGRQDPLGREIGTDPTMGEEERKEWIWWQEMIIKDPGLLTREYEQEGRKYYPRSEIYDPRVLEAIRIADSPSDMYRSVLKLFGKNVARELLHSIYYGTVAPHRLRGTRAEREEWERRTDAWLKEHH